MRHPTGLIAATLATFTTAFAVIAIHPAAADVGLSIASSTVFRVEPAESLVRVEATYSVTNVTPDLTRGGRDTRYYYDGLTIPLPTSATAIRAVDHRSGSPLATAVREDAGFSFADALDISFAGKLFYGESARFTVTYRLESGPPRDSTSGVRVNPAYAGFGAWGLGDANAVDVRVEVPVDFDVSISGSPYTSRVEGDLRIYEATEIAQPEEFFLFVTARNDAALASRPVDVGPDTVIDVRYWPGDDEWADFVATELEDGFPVLGELVGLPFPADDLEILQSVDPGLLGYAGWYLPDQDRIEVSEELDAETLLHELSHAWFNGELFAERWIIEGLAQEFASRAHADPDGELTWPSTPRSTSHRIALNRWSTPGAIDDETRGNDAYGYNTSWFVLRELSEEVGIDGLAKAIRWAEADLHAYPGEGATELVDRPVDDWRRLLDLLEEAAGSQRATGLFSKYVTGDDQDVVLAERSRTRAEWDRLLDRSGSWAAPLVLRRALGDWDFRSARQLMDTANQLLDRRDRLRVTIERLGLDLIRSPERQYQDASTHEALVAVSLRLADLQVAADAIALADHQLSAERSVIDRIGLIGTNVDTPLQKAREAFENGHTSLARESAGRTVADLRGSATVGLLRIFIVAGAVLLLVGPKVWRQRSGSGRRHQLLHGSDDGLGEDVKIRAGIGVGPQGHHQLAGVGQGGSAHGQVEAEGHDGHHLGDRATPEVQGQRRSRQVGGHEVGEGLTPGDPRNEVHGNGREMVARIEQ